MYQEGVYPTLGGDLSLLKTYLMSKALYDINNINETQLISEFCYELYGNIGGSVIINYIESVTNSAHNTNTYLSESMDVTTSYLTPQLMISLGRNFTNSLKQMSNTNTTLDERRLESFKLAYLPTLYVFLLRWNEFLNYTTIHKIKWPLQETKINDAFETFAQDCVARFCICLRIPMHVDTFANDSETCLSIS